MSSHPRVKICGLTNLADALVAVDSGADLLGFIFFEPSPRYVSPERVRKIVRTIKDQAPDPPLCVGVFVNRSRTEVAEIRDTCDLDLIQFHGEEDADYVADFAGKAFKACNPRTMIEAEAATTQFLNQTTAPFILMDAYHPQLRGGTGHIGDWAIAAQIAKNHRLVLAGGLTPSNVQTAIAQVHPWGVDVSSGVEASKGIKDHDKVRAFMQAVRESKSVTQE